MGLGEWADLAQAPQRHRLTLAGSGPLRSPLSAAPRMSGEGEPVTRAGGEPWAG